MRRKGFENVTITGHTVKRREEKNQCVTYLKKLCEWVTDWGQWPMLNSRTDSYICSRWEVMDMYGRPRPELIRLKLHRNKVSSSALSSSATSFPWPSVVVGSLHNRKRDNSSPTHIRTYQGWELKSYPIIRSVFGQVEQMETVPLQISSKLICSNFKAQLGHGYVATDALCGGCYTQAVDFTQGSPPSCPLASL